MSDNIVCISIMMPLLFSIDLRSVLSVVSALLFHSSEILFLLRMDSLNDNALDIAKPTEGSGSSHEKIMSFTPARLNQDGSDLNLSFDFISHSKSGRKQEIILPSSYCVISVTGSPSSFSRIKRDILIPQT